ncbi:hypothetical protein P168DRAFT_286926 [Aspergillus campestris IBT 28561]|uniref:Regulator of phospholipase D SRF1 n=1 Tax=Aspergillus campestris (strain IBT 28561) TaxID=1392248 RepID=A0A2I1DG56_ASPC2|nr:uncharacterized protein P168DRAFT_286926 [Aspergillus campestris IBT 28561]PKY08852.1 hypothetical protein P168DRAFT_286926 [Aspergillus campestris IBT 28561]
MAQNGQNSRAQPLESEVISDKQQLEFPPIPEWTPEHSEQSLSGPTSDTRSSDAHRNSTTEQSSNVPRLSEDSATYMTRDNPNGAKRLRSVPAWVQSVDHPEEGDGDELAESSVTDRLLPAEPHEAVVAQHNHSPSATRTSNLQHQGGSADEGLGQPPRRETRWISFSRTIAYPRDPGLEEKAVPPEWLDENYNDYSQPWRGQLPSDETEDPLKMKRRRKIWFKRFHSTLLKSPIVPLIFRLTVWCFSLTALALGSSIHQLSGEYQHPRGPSALMAIIVDAVALVYLVYITWDEYTAKPLGLRPPSAKARLILLDIFFIVFDSANLSLAFEALSTARGACTNTEVNRELAPKNDAICDRQIALASVLLVALIAWLTTFSISVLRLVERVAK